jgi:hypothetical protein
MNAGALLQVASLGPYALNVIVPVGLPPVLRVAVSLIDWPKVAAAVA